MTDTTLHAGLSGFHWTGANAAAADQRRTIDAARRTTANSEVEQLIAARRQRRAAPSGRVLEEVAQARADALVARNAELDAGAAAQAAGNAAAAELAAQTNGLQPQWFAEGVAATAERAAQRRLDHLNRQRALMGKPPVDADGNEIAPQ
ncbi:hypothetical protein [Rhodococcus sp. 11-3]|uniref:hypothetical protein n=1 Tax=Rhodococcus sp. 11-3 TaxID=2854796 RepID=UPI00203FF5CF|nr:hypothetical protein [Rhodococcus sp. 11-3]USC18456.1 hypothetical protein KZJ41_28230 [Rhodococcus sp. 11-3]